MDFQTTIDVTPNMTATGSPAAAFGNYDATVDKGKRRAPSGATQSEDRVLFADRRHKLIGGARDLPRNFAIAQWAVRKHVDFVTRFLFHSRTGNKVLDDRIEKIIAEDSKRGRNDICGRHRLARMLRIQEFRRVVDGDCGVLRVRVPGNGGRLQLIEGDRIRDPLGKIGVHDPALHWVHGVQVDDVGRAINYAIHGRGRDGASFVFEQSLPAERMFLNGYFEHADQTRGISPLSAAINSFQDVYEGIDYALAKAKVSQLFAMIITREGEEAIVPQGPVATADADGDGENDSDYKVDFGRGPIKLDMNPGDDAKFLESATPSSQFQDFMQLVIMVALKSLDIPFSFFDEAHTNFFGSRGSWLHYEESARSKREDNLELLDWITRWRLKLAILDGRLELPRGWRVRDLEMEHVPGGMPWWNPQQEITGELMAIGAGLDTPQRIIKSRGTGDWQDNIDSISDYLAYARKKGVPILFQAGNTLVQAEQVGREDGGDGSTQEGVDDARVE